MIDFEVQRCTRRCAATERPFAPGEEFYSVLRAEDGAVERLDFCRDSWREPTDGVIAWWRSRMPEDAGGGAKLAPDDVLLRLFDEWGDQPERSAARYVLALLLIRRKAFRIAAPILDDDDRDDLLRVECPRRDESYELPVATPDAEHAAAIQAELNQLLYADSP